MRLLGFILSAVVLGSTQGFAQAPAPNDHASTVAKTKVATHRQTPAHPAPEASETAKSKFGQPTATTVRGSVIAPTQQPVTPATPAVPAQPATPATPSAGGGPAVPATPAVPAIPAVPASPSQKPSSPGNSGSHRP